jgi:hypothetical protein
MPKRVLAVTLLTLVTAASPSVTGHGDDADVVFEWNGILQASLALPPPAGVPPAGLQGFRYYAMMHVAMFDAVNSIEERYRPYFVRVRSSHGASGEAAAAQAAHDVLAAVLPVNMAAYDAALAARLATIPPGRRSQGVNVGKKVAAKILAWRQNDGWLTPPPAYVLPPFPGLWQPTPPANAPAGFTQLPGTRPFALLTNTQFLHALPPTLTSVRYAEDFNEVKRVGRNTAGPADRTDDQTKQAQLWAGVISSTSLNAIWNNVARDTARSKGLDLVDTARVFALLDVSMNDSILTSHSSKFIYGLWRPVTAIRRAAEDLNDLTEADPTWSSLIATPPYPSYGGNMACVGAGAATALALAFGTDDVPLTVVWKGTVMPPNPDVTKEFPGFWALAVDEADSRIYAGIHYRFDNEESQIVCPKISHFAFDNYMQPKDNDR